MKWMIVAGFVLGAAGFVIGLLLNERPLGMQVFIAGFVVALIGMVAEFLGVRSIGKSARTTKGLQIAAIGMSVATIGIFVRILFEDLAVVPEVLFFIGIAAICAGIFLGARGITRNGVDLE